MTTLSSSRLTAFLLFSMSTSSLLASTVSLDKRQINPTAIEIIATFALADDELLYKDSLHLTVDNPNITLSPWSTSSNPIQQYEKAWQETKSGYRGNVAVTTTATIPATFNDDTFLHLFYQTNSMPCPQQEIMQLTHTRATTQEQTKTKNARTQQAVQPKPEITRNAGCATSESKTFFAKFTDWIMRAVQQTTSLPLRIILVFLLGILLSLTPCIYPMIPITIGIIHVQKRVSFLHSLGLLASYTVGISTTFASLGLLSGYVGPLYGKLLSNPFAILVLVTFFGYLAFSMFGLYEPYLPRFLQRQYAVRSEGSLLTTFLFGVASGTVASPCLSPGLVLLLSITAAIGNPVIGFLLLFFFGVGLCLPLFVVGSFSSSLTFLPQAGSWMLEIKKFIGMLLLGVCMYYLHFIMPFAGVLLLTAVVMLALGIHYLYTAHKNTATKTVQRFNNFFGLVLIASATVIAVQGWYVARFAPSTSAHQWLLNAEDAFSTARTENKLLLIYFRSDFCSLCSAVHKKLMQPGLASVFEQFVLLKIDGTKEQQEPYKTLKTTYNIVGFPTILLVDPVTKQVVKRWTSEFYYMNEQEIEKELTILPTNSFF